MPQSCKTICNQIGKADICVALVKATQFNTRLFGQDGHGLPPLSLTHKEEINQDDMLQAPQVPLKENPEDLKGNFIPNSFSFFFDIFFLFFS